MSTIQIVCLIALVLGSLAGCIIFFYQSFDLGGEAIFTFLGILCLVVCIVTLGIGAFGLFG